MKLGDSERTFPSTNSVVEFSVEFFTEVLSAPSNIENAVLTHSNNDMTVDVSQGASGNIFDDVNIMETANNYFEEIAFQQDYQCGDQTSSYQQFCVRWQQYDKNSPIPPHQSAEEDMNNPTIRVAMDQFFKCLQAGQENRIVLKVGSQAFTSWRFTLLAEAEPASFSAFWCDVTVPCILLRTDTIILIATQQIAP